jgi:phospholipid/cholesterol/gamma-HCH transport system substrate-binding protein
MSRAGKEILLGLSVLVCAIAAVWLALSAANLVSFDAGSGYDVSARFDDVGGLKTRAPVCSAGVEVGRVKRIAFDGKTFQGVVTLQISSQYRFPTDTSAKIVTAGLLGDQYVDLDPGGDDTNLKANGTIQYTQSALALEKLIGQLLSSRAAAVAKK